MPSTYSFKWIILSSPYSILTFLFFQLQICWTNWILSFLIIFTFFQIYLSFSFPYIIPQTIYFPVLNQESELTHGLNLHIPLFHSNKQLKYLFFFSVWNISLHNGNKIVQNVVYPRTNFFSRSLIPIDQIHKKSLPLFLWLFSVSPNSLSPLASWNLGLLVEIVKLFTIE